MAKKIHEWIGLSSIAYFDVLREALGGHEAATRIHCRVRNALLLDAHLRSFWRFVEEHEEKPEYDLSTFAYNVQCIVEDADNGAIGLPVNEDEWVRLVIHQYKSAVCNTGLCPEYLAQFRREERYWRQRRKEGVSRRGQG